MPFRAILFDLDGTLLDTLTDIAHAANEALEREGFPAHAEADYLRPLRFGDRVEVAIVAAQTGSRSPTTEVTLGYRIANLNGGEPAAVAQTVHTFVDRKTFERVSIPEGLERAFRALGS